MWPNLFRSKCKFLIEIDASEEKFERIEDSMKATKEICLNIWKIETYLLIGIHRLYP